MTEHKTYPSFSSEQWIEAIHSSRQADIATAENFNPFATYMGSIVEGRSVDEQFASEHAEDAGVQLKNRFLCLLAELADDERYHTGDMLALMDRQACDMYPADETRYRQFMGLWDLAVALSKDPELLKEFKNSY